MKADRDVANNFTENTGMLTMLIADGSLWFIVLK